DDILRFNNHVGDIEFMTASLSRFWIDYSGNVGIGMTSPVARLHVSGNITGQPIFKVENASAPNALVVSNNGYVGIGTANPTSKLEVQSSIYPVIKSVRYSNLTNSLYTSFLSVHRTTADMLDNFGSLIEFGIQDNADVLNSIGAIGAMRDGADNSGKIVFQNSNAGTYYTRMVIDHLGNVGVGTSNPAALLHIKHGADLPSVLMDGGNKDLAIPDGQSMQFGHWDGSSTFTQRMIIYADGNVGIGVAAPSAKLDVSGNVRISGNVIYNGSGTANITAVGGINPTNTYMRIQGNGGAVDITAVPQIAAGSDGQLLILKGCSDTNTVKIDTNNGVRLNGGISFTMGKGDILQLIYDAADTVWYEVSRSDN
nr:hypothetical protein [Candidatus Margulisiibacteriota bacterium]